MAFLTTNPNPFLLNVPELQNVITSANGAGSGAVASLSNSLNDILTYIDTTTATVSANNLTTYNAGAITVRNNLNIVNGSILMNDSDSLTSNSIYGTQYLSIQIDAIERARVTPTGTGIGVNTPLAALDIQGSEVIRGNLYISTMGVAYTSTIGNLYADGIVYTAGVVYPSDPILKTNIQPYISRGLPDPIEFTWKTTGARDIGVLATDMFAIDPVCVRSTSDGTLGVDYPKLTILCLAEIRTLHANMKALESTIRGLTA